MSKNLFLRSLIDSIPDLIFFKDKNSRYLGCNRAFELFIGKSEAELIGRHDNEVVDDGKAGEYQAQDQLVMESGEQLKTEGWHVFKDGRRVLIENIKTPYYDENHQIMGVIGVGRDITERWLSRQRGMARLNILEMIARHEPLEKILLTVVESLETEEPSRQCSILLVSDDNTHLLTGAAPNLPDFYNQVVHGLPIAVGLGSCGTAAATGMRVIVEDIQTHEHWANYKTLAANAGLGACWSQPVISSRGRVLGTFAIYHALPCSPTQDDLESIEFAASLTSIAIEYHQTQDALEKQATTDSLTGLANRRYFRTLAEAEISRQMRSNRSLSLLYLDIDYFKSINDQYGHQAGDQVLTAVAAYFRISLRDQDVIARIGGEEFAILLPDTSSTEAQEIAERIRTGFAMLKTEGLPSDIKLTVSIGLTTLDTQTVTLDELLNQADRALYQAKKLGRNQTRVFQTA
ncbi:GGDEF domain-containing protein [Leeia oryzae]|uniref:GGDEF domain-containing protein n=1 Tax=Leeia oryzae TaxID=356662 RepID=UPI0003678D6B|nr:sensor domain-containing diguanylate cyclase [Leeia oryzae]